MALRSRHIETEAKVLKMNDQESTHESEVSTHVIRKAWEIDDQESIHKIEVSTHGDSV